MPINLDRKRVNLHLQNLDLQTLFIEELGWDHGGTDLEIPITDNTYALEAIAQKRGMVAYQYKADSDDTFPNHPIRQKIERAVTRTVREHIIIYAAHDGNTLYWQWVKSRTRTNGPISSVYLLPGSVGRSLNTKAGTNSRRTGRRRRSYHWPCCEPGACSLRC